MKSGLESPSPRILVSGHSHAGKVGAIAAIQMLGGSVYRNKGGGWSFVQLARVVRVSFNVQMRGGAVTILLGLTALISYFIGRQDAPPAAPSASAITHPGYSKPVALVDAPLHVRAIQPQPTPTPSSTPSDKASQPSASAPQPDTKRKVEVVLTAAAIATIIIKASRDRYYATGRIWL